MSDTPLSKAPAPQAQPPRATQELRFAVVMYGGVSLAIYIHGVAQELLRLVRSTACGDVSDDPVTSIYQEMSGKVRDVTRTSDETRPTRYVVDILSGTSAGGINAVFLAKALAIGARDIDDLRRTWLDTGDLDKLLNRGKAFEPKRSLLNGRWMYAQLCQAFERMSAKTSPATLVTELIDLFVTTTDLNGVAVPMQLSDMAIPEEVHKGFFQDRKSVV